MKNIVSHLFEIHPNASEMKNCVTEMRSKKVQKHNKGSHLTHQPNNWKLLEIFLINLGYSWKPLLQKFSGQFREFCGNEIMCTWTELFMFEQSSIALYAKLNCYELLIVSLILKKFHLLHNSVKFSKKPANE